MAHRLAQPVAPVEVWDQPLHALRRFRINELERDKALGLRTSEIREFTGHSEATAQQYYSSVTSQDRMRIAERSSQLAKTLREDTSGSPKRADPLPNHRYHEPSGPIVDAKFNRRTSERPALNRIDQGKLGIETFRENLAKCKIPRRGVEPLLPP